MPWADPASLRRNNLDLFRLLLAAGVVFSHSFAALQLHDQEPVYNWTGKRLNLGHICVCGFFAISGFLISASWDRTRSFRVFAWHRILRLYPAFLLMTAVSAFVIAPLAGGTAPDVARIGTVLLDTLRLRSRVYEGAFATNPDPTSYNISVWTVPYEARCYVFVALLGLIPILPARIKAVLGCLSLMALTLIEPPQFSNTISAIWKELALPSVMWFKLAYAFSAGLLLHVFRIWVPYRDWLAGLACAGLLICCSFPEWRVAGLATFGMYLFFYLAFHRRPLLPDLARNYGDASYGLFLYGFPTQQIVILFFGASLGPYTLCVIALPIALAAGFASWHGFEKWFMRLKDRGPGRMN